MHAIILADTMLFLSTLSLRRATTCNLLDAHRVKISIHALLAESDPGKVSSVLPGLDFYPRSPCGERQYSRSGGQEASYFYPRSPCGERPPSVFLHCTTYLFLSTLSLRRATQWEGMKSLSEVISIHALLAESDRIGLVFLWWGVRFLSTLSLRRATRQTYRKGEERAFLSTLSLRRATLRKVPILGIK